MSSSWKFLKATGVYLYPSANADDGGDVNSEHNIAGITDKLIQKNFIVRKNLDSEPLKIEIKDYKFLSILEGEAIINGYRTEFDAKGSEYVVRDAEILASNIEGYSSYFNKFTRIYNQWYENGVKKTFAKGKEPDPIPKLYVVIKLLKDTTGNLRGDLLNLESDGTIVNYCRGAAWGVVTENNLASLDAPHIVLGSFIPGEGSSEKTLVIKEEDKDFPYNDRNRYSYLYIDSVYVDNRTLSQYIVNQIEESSDTQDTLTHYIYDDGDKTKSRQKDLEFTTKNSEVKVVRYKKKSPDAFDENGNYIVEPVNTEDDYDKSYSVDEIQRRTHPSSQYISEGDAEAEGQLARRIDSHDNGKGTYSAIGTVGTSTVTHNGISRLLARADHSHDVRYLRTSNGETEETDTTEVNTKYQTVRRLRVNQKLSVKRLRVGPPVDPSSSAQSSDFNVWENGDITSKYINTYNNEEGGTPSILISKRMVATDESHKELQSQDSDAYNGKVNLEVNGDVRADRVYNAVWNDYAELYKKDCPKEEVEPGVVICKVEGKDTYAPSTYDNRRLVVGVVSDTYGHIVGGDPDKSLDENLKFYYPVALSGRVYVKLAPRCIVKEGDLLSVSGFEGRVVACEHPELGTVVGKALESSDYENPKDKILMQVMLK